MAGREQPTTPTSLRAARARVEVLDTRAIQGLPPFNRYVHLSYEVVLELAVRWAEELASMALMPEISTSGKLSPVAKATV